FSYNAQYVPPLPRAPVKAPSNHEAYKNFPLLGLLLANRELILDDVGEFMEKYQLQRHQQGLISKYIKELKHKGTQQICQDILTPSQLNEADLIRGILAFLLKFSKMVEWPVLLARLLMLVQEDEKEIQRFQARIAPFELEEAIRKKILQHIGKPLTTFDREGFVQLLEVIRYNQIMAKISQLERTDPYTKCKIEGLREQRSLELMLERVNRSENRVRNQYLGEAFQEVIQASSSRIKGKKLIEVYGLEADYALYTSDMQVEILSRLAKKLELQPDKVMEWIERLTRLTIMQEDLEETSAFFRYAAEFFKAINQVQTLILNTPEAYIQQYQDEWQKIDRYYRKSIFHLRQINRSELPEVLQLEPVYGQIDTLYQKHTEVLNREWLTCMADIDFQYNRINQPKQYDFYQTEVKPFDQKAAVIISDALRYEVATELLSELHSDPKNTASLNLALASLPSTTYMGMGQLLPYQNLTLDTENLSIKVGEKSSAGLDNRQQILSDFHVDAKAVSFETVTNQGQDANRALFRHKLVYIYHDRIDAFGDKKGSEGETFKAVEESIKELGKLIKTLHATYNVARVLITADHGFLYFDREPEDKDLEKAPTEKGIKHHSRYFLSSKADKTDLGYCVPIRNVSRVENELYVGIPKSTNRYRRQGAGHRFFHGGGSLQELIIPIIESSRKRVEVTRKVKPIIGNPNKLTIASNTLKITVVQENKVSGMEKEREIELGLFKAQELVSNNKRLQLNSTDDSPSARIQKVILTLLPQYALERQLKLKIFDIEDRLNPILEHDIVNNTITEQDF
ncbi:MAG: BREX-1 system phosphatase PglZ type A, partial [Bacteroidota bacterium]